jgi:hypothetical protein
MILPVAKLGTLLLKTMSKPIASRLKAEASRHPKFRQLIINLAQVRLLPLAHPPSSSHARLVRILRGDLAAM